MDISNMHIAVKLELDKSSALELPAFEPEEIDFWLNNAIRKFVKTRYSGMNVKGTSFEQTQKRTDDLRTLLVVDTISSISSSQASRFENGSKWDLPVDYWFSIRETISVWMTTPAEIFHWGVIESTWDEIDARLLDPYSEHILHYNVAKPIRLFNGETIEIITDGNYNIGAIVMTYIKAPVTVDLSGTTDCDLPEHTHDEIVKLAVSMMLENIEQPRYQTYQNEVNIIE